MTVENLIELIKQLQQPGAWIGLGILCIFINLLKK